MPPELGNLHEMEAMCEFYRCPLLMLIGPFCIPLLKHHCCDTADQSSTTSSRPSRRSCWSATKRSPRLSLWTNAIETLPPEIGEMANLQELWLYRNRISVVPPEIGKLKKAQAAVAERELDPDTLPAELAGCESLQELYIDANQLQTVPEELSGLTDLRKLYLDNNPELELPALLAGLSVTSDVM